MKCYGGATCPVLKWEFPHFTASVLTGTYRHRCGTNGNFRFPYKYHGSSVITNWPAANCSVCFWIWPCILGPQESQSGVVDRGRTDNSTVSIRITVSSVDLPLFSAYYALSPSWRWGNLLGLGYVRPPRSGTAPNKYATILGPQE